MRMERKVRLEKEGERERRERYEQRERRRKEGVSESERKREIAFFFQSDLYFSKTRCHLKLNLS